MLRQYHSFPAHQAGSHVPSAQQGQTGIDSAFVVGTVSSQVAGTGLQPALAAVDEQPLEPAAQDPDLMLELLTRDRAGEANEQAPSTTGKTGSQLTVRQPYLIYAAYLQRVVLCPVTCVKCTSSDKPRVCLK
jgi:hypothetical protein